MFGKKDSNKKMIVRLCLSVLLVFPEVNVNIKSPDNMTKDDGTHVIEQKPWLMIKPQQMNNVRF